MQSKRNKDMLGLVNKGEVEAPEQTSLRLKNGAHLVKYRLKRCLGTGGACEVWDARDSVEDILAVDPKQRFANAGKMLTAMIEALPKSHQKMLALKQPKKENDWRKARREIFFKRCSRVVPVIFRCLECDEPIAERIQFCL